MNSTNKSNLKNKESPKSLQKKIFLIKKDPFKIYSKTLKVTPDSKLYDIKKNCFLNNKRVNKALSTNQYLNDQINYKSAVMLIYDKNQSHSIKLYPSVFLKEDYSFEKVMDKIKINKPNHTISIYSKESDKYIIDPNISASNLEVDLIKDLHFETKPIQAILDYITENNHSIDYIERALNTELFSLFKSYSLTYPISIYLNENLKKLKSEESLVDNILLYFTSLQNKEKAEYYNDLIAKLDFLLKLKNLIYDELKNTKELSTSVLDETDLFLNASQILKDEMASNPITNTAELDSINKLKIGFANVIGSNYELSSNINLTHFNIQDENFALIFTGLKFSSSLIELNLSHNTLGNIGCFELGRFLTINESIKILDISHCHLTDINILSLQKGISINSLSKNEAASSLVKLNISHNSRITSKTSTSLFVFLFKLKKLESLNISYIELPIEVLIKLNSAYLKQGLRPSLKRLIAIKVNSSCSQLITFSKLLESREDNKYLSLLESLVLSNNNLNYKEFFENLAKNKSLTEVLLSHCKLNEDVIPQLKDFIIQSKVSSLSLYANQFNKSSLMQLLNLTFACDVGNRPTEIDASTNISDLDKDKENDKLKSINFLNESAPLANLNNINSSIEESIEHEPEENENDHENPNLNININKTPLVMYDNISNERNNPYSINLTSLDISKNGCNELLCEELFNILTKTKLKLLDLTGNFNELTLEDKCLFRRVSAVASMRSKKLGINIYV